MKEGHHKRRRNDRERGAALVSVVVVVAVMAVTTADFAFNTTMDLAAAANARDDLRAHFLARSGINLSRLLFRLQQRIIDPNRKFLGGMDLQVADYAPLLMSAFNSKEGAALLGSLFGISEGEIKGIGVDVGTYAQMMGHSIEEALRVYRTPTALDVQGALERIRPGVEPTGAGLRLVAGGPSRSD